MSADGAASISRVGRVGFWAGLIVGLGLIAVAPWLPRPSTLEVQAVYLVAVTLWVGIWWISEALPLGATALLPAATFPLFGIATSREVSPAYASPFILLLLGGFLLAMAVERSQVHRRIALHVLVGVGTSPRRLILGFGIAAAALSMWISNTATTLIMMPIALAVADRAGPDGHRFGVAVLLSVAYSASVGGMGTPVGTPPNLIAMGALEEQFPDGPALNFVEWSARALPAVVVIVPLVWLSLTRVFPRVPRTLNLGADEMIRTELDDLGAWRPSEVRALAVFGLAAVLWVTRPDLQLGDDWMVAGWASRLGIEGASDATVALLAAVVAFSLPSGERDGERLLPWETAMKAPWGLVLLFGGGVALSKGFEKTGLSAYLGAALADLVEAGLVPFAAVSALAATFGTEIISNTALANIVMPILASTARAADIDPRTLLVPVAMACSCAFMMPAATGPNAIVFGTGKVRIGEMVMAGFLANLFGWAVIVVVTVIFR